MFRAGTLSRLKRPSLFRSCRWEASPKAQGFSEDASRHARKHKTPTEGTAHGVHRSVPENQRIRHSGFFALPQKVCRPSAKKFSDRPLFQKGSPGAGREPCKKHWVQGGSPARNTGCRAGALQETLGAGREPCKKHWAQAEPCKKHWAQAEPCKERRVAGRKPCKEQVGFILDFLRSRKYNGGRKTGEPVKHDKTRHRGEKRNDSH